MGRPVNADAAATWSTIRRAGIRLMFTHGFEAMNLRQLAAESGLKPGSLYNYFASKDQFLWLILRDIMQEILTDLEDSVGSSGTPRARLQRFIAFHIRWHTARRVETFIGSMEMRHLSKADYKNYVQLRRRYEDYLTAILQDGIQSGDFSMIDVRITTLAILSMLTGAYTWYKKTGRLSQRELSAIYTDLVFRMADSSLR